MIDWNDNAKAAVREFAEYVGRSDFCERYLASVETKKTVADAYESHKTWHSIPDDTEALYCEPIVLWHIKDKHFHKGNTNFNDKVFYKVCTRAEFEAYVKEQEGKKWTHTDRDICECRVISTEGNLSWIQYKEGAHHVVPSAHLKPIKQTISKAEAWDKIHLMQNVSILTDKYDII